MAKKKPAAKPKKKKTFGSVVLHTHKHGSDTYICKTAKVAQLKAARLVLENIDEFVDAGTVARDGLDCLEALLEGDYNGAIDIYAEFVGEKSENIEIDVKVEILDEMEKFDKKELRNKLAEFLEMQKKEADRAEKETDNETDEEDETEDDAGGDSSGSSQVTNSEDGGGDSGSYGGQSDATSQGTD
jgi:hypothetical protein